MARTCNVRWIWKVYISIHPTHSNFFLPRMAPTAVSFLLWSKLGQRSSLVYRGVAMRIVSSIDRMDLLRSDLDANIR